MTQTMPIEQSESQASQVKALFGFARELGKVRRENIIWLSRQPWHLFLKDVDAALPGVAKWTPAQGASRTLLSVVQQDLPVCPEPDPRLKALLSAGWDDPEWEPEPELLRKTEESPELAALWTAWESKRREWMLRWSQVSEAMDLFQTLYREARAIEDGNLKYVAKAGSVIFSSDRSHQGALHPVLTQQVNIRILTENGRAAVSVEIDPGEPPRFESERLSGFQDDGFRLEACQNVREDVERLNPHPFFTGAVRESFQRLAAVISPDSRWTETPDAVRFDERSHFAFYEDPVIWIEERVSGMPEAADRIIREINAGKPIPKHLTDLVCGAAAAESENAPAETEEADRLMEIGGEDLGVLFTRPANREQLGVARQIASSDAVLVMGPPGTGKTHSIANIVGDLLARGKTVLVSSQKEKALRVLKSMLPQEMQELCVSFSSEQDNVFSTIQALSDRLFLVNPDELKEKIDAEEAARNRTYEELKAARGQIYSRICREQTPQNFGGESWVPGELGRWLFANEKDAAGLPAETAVSAPFPLTAPEISELAGLNASVTPETGREIASGILSANGLLRPEEQKHLAAEEAELRRFLAQSPVRMTALKDAEGRLLRYETGNCTFEVRNCPGGPVASLSEWLERDRTVGMPEAWVVAARAAGASGGALRARWEKLSAALSEAAALAEKEIGQMDDYTVEISPEADRTELREAITYFKENNISGVPGFLTRLTQKTRLISLGGATVNGHVPASEHDYSAVLLRLDLEEARSTAEKLWNSLVEQNGGPAFSSLSREYPEEQIRLRYGPRLEKAIRWWDDWAQPLLEKIRSLGINPDLFTGGTGAGPIEQCEALTENTERVLRPAVVLDRVGERLKALEEVISAAEAALEPAAGAGSASARQLKGGLRAEDGRAYEEAWRRLEQDIRPKQQDAERRQALIDRIAAVSPELASVFSDRAKAVQADRVIRAWNWNFRNTCFKAYLGVDLEQLQEKAEKLAQQFREKTAALARDRAWHSLAVRMQNNPSLMQKLQGWAQVAGRLGRGTSRNAEVLRAQARELMAACAETVPCWIMPAERALSTFDGTWKFDVVVIDEASQSDIVSMPLLFLAKKAIIVGDDKQVSPAAVGVGDSAVTALSRQYIQDKVANWQIYQAQASLYDLAKTVYVPHMLREHFRCVPYIIGYSNELSYAGRILPLRDSASAELMPPVVQCRVEGIRDSSDCNRAEAEAIAGRIKACLSEPAYQDKSFGIIVMRSGKTGAQIQLINDLLYRTIGPRLIEKHRILCGLSPDFQGDERDVVFISLVDSPDGDKPLRREGSGIDDAMKKRWNVAVSRARDQLWVVYSFDPDRQLQEGDIRKTFFDYLKKPQTDEVQEGGAGTPFAEEVAHSLEAKGFRLHRNYRVGAFTLPLVAEGPGRKKVAIECDGEVPSADAALAVRCMERQVILERVGWRFIRIGAGEWYRDPLKVVEKVTAFFERTGVRVPEASAGEKTSPDILIRQIQEKAEQFTESVKEDLATVAARRSKRERIIAELRKLEAEVDHEVRKGSRMK